MANVRVTVGEERRLACFFLLRTRLDTAAPRDACDHHHTFSLLPWNCHGSLALATYTVVLLLRTPGTAAYTIQEA